jgi:hypothetical protein
MVAHVEAGLTRRAAAGAAGVPTSTAYEWLNDPAFVDLVEAAEGRCERRVVERVLEAVDKGSWRAGMDFLRHRWPERWQTHEAIELAASIDLSNRTEAELIAEIERYRLASSRAAPTELEPPRIGEIVGTSVAEEWSEPVPEPPRLLAPVPEPMPAESEPEVRAAVASQEATRDAVPSQLATGRASKVEPEQLLRWVCVPRLDYRKHVVAQTDAAGVVVGCGQWFDAELVMEAEGDESPCDRCRGLASG